MKRTIAFFVFLSFLTFSHNVVFAQLKTKAQLEAELKDLEAQIEQHKKNIAETQKQGASLSRDISVLNQQIKQSQAQIKLHEATIVKLDDNISEKDKTIGMLNDKMSREKDSLAQIMRKSLFLDNYSLLDFSLQSQTLSNFFADSDAFLSLQRALNQSFAQIRSTEDDLNKVKTELIDTKFEEVSIKNAKLLEKKKVETNQKAKTTLLVETKGQEAVYKKLLTDKEKQAAQIRAALFELSGAKSINFGQAYDLAVKAQQATGIRPAFLLGLITVESNLGQNVGKGTWTVDMHPTRDQPVFKTICAQLGLNPDDMPVSKKQWYGYGGAMGPAQFIPSTWVLYQSRVAKITGNNPPNPWAPSDAFMAAALYLTDSGAVSGNRTSEHRAAMCYLAGCGNAKKASLQFYGNDVLSYADKYEAQIKILQGN